MEILTVKNNKMDYSTFKKIIILLFPTKYKITFITVFSLDFIGLLFNGIKLSGQMPKTSLILKSERSFYFSH